MQVIQILNQNNQALNVQAIRYFSVEDKRYFVFSLNEIDEQGYIKVYVSKVLGLNGTIAAYDIIDETEWAKVKEVVKSIIKANREGSTVPVTDLDMNLLRSMKVNGQQVFKLLTNLIELVGANINVVSDVIPSVPVEPVAPVPEIDSNVDSVPVAPVVPEVDSNVDSVSVAPVVPEVDSNVDSVPVAPVVPEVDSNVDSLPVAPVVPEVDSNADSLPVAPVVSNDNMETKLAEDIPASLEASTQTELANSSVSNEESYKDLYLEQLQKNEQLLAEVTRYKTQLESIKAILQ